MALDFTAMMGQGYGVPTLDPLMQPPAPLVPQDRSIALGPEGGTEMSALTELSNILNGAAAKPMKMSAPNAGLPKVQGIGTVAAPKAAAAIDPATFKALAAILQGGR